MRSPFTNMVHHLVCRTKNPPSQRANDCNSPRRLTNGLAGIAALIVFAALAVTALAFPSRQGFSIKRLTNSPTAAAAPSEAPKPARVESNSISQSVDALLAAPSLNLAHSLAGASLIPPAPLPPSSDPEVTFYAADCSTPQTIFSPGQTVCAKVNGLDTSLFSAHFDWVTSDGFIVSRSSTITADGQSATFSLSGAGVGGWQADVIDQGGTIRAVGKFTVSDAEHLATDLSLNVDGIAKVTPGNDFSYTVVLFNRGPDAAENVVLTDVIPANTTFVAVGQSTGPVFNCTGDSGSTVCTIASMPADTVSIFTFTYNVPRGTPADTAIINSATVSSTTTERNEADNTDTAETLTDSTPCVVSCPTSITVQADANQAGAFVTFDAPTSTGDCTTPSPTDDEAVSCSQASGSFFPVGTTLVTCAAQSGEGCHFTVTVENPGGLSISLNGANPLPVECGSVVVVDGQVQGFTDPGATAINATGNSVPVTVTGSANVSAPGSYTITYTATEGENVVSTTRTVNVVDTTAPIINIDGANPYQIQQGSCLPFIDPGATATDGCAGSVAVTRSISGPNGLTAVDNNVPGTYTITYTATDGTLSATATRTVLVGNFPADEIDQPSTSGPPTITLNGDHQMTVECGSFVDPGATANVCGGTVPVTVSGTVESHPGTYTLTYRATSGGQTSEATRIVTVEDTTRPVITLSGPNPMQVECHTAFTDPGATATDACAGSVPVTVSGSVDPNTPGTYTLTYSATDGINPPSQVTRTVNVVDTKGPDITINGANPATVECHTSYTDAGATAFDTCLNASIPVTPSGSVDVNTPGTYIITYTATDGARSSTKTRTVNVVDTTPPVISCPANVVVQLPLNSTATSMVVNYPAATANDTCAATTNITYSKASGTVFPAGSTTITVTATDASGNSSTCTFTVTVLYNFTGFFSPVSNLPTVNVVNAGRAIPVKFSLSGNKGLNILAGTPESGVVACDFSAPASNLTETVTAGSSSLSYDASSDQYSYIWKTDSAWAGSCRQLVITLNDGTTHIANFRFK